MDRRSKGDLFLDFAFNCKIQNPDCKIEILISQSNTTLEFVPEEARLLIADEDDRFFFSDQMGPADVSRLQQPGF